MGQSAITSVNLGSPNLVQSFVDGDLSSGVLTVNHNLNAQYVGVTVFNNNGLIIIPDDVDVVSTTQLTVDLTSYGTLSGTWQVTIANTGGTFSKSIADDLNISGATTDDRLVYDGSNWVRKEVVAFFARKTTAQTNIGTGNIAVTFDSTRFNVGGHFDTGTDTFTAPIAGFYQINCDLTFNQMDNTASSYCLTIVTNASMGSQSIHIDPSQFAGIINTKWAMTLSHVFQLAATNTISVRADITGGGGNTDINSDGCHLSGYLLA